MKTKWLGWVGVALATSLLMAGCGGGSSGDPKSPVEPALATGTITGRVVSSATGSALPGVTVRAGATIVTTAADGSYTLTADLGERVVIGVETAGFAETFQVIRVIADQTVLLDVQLLPVGVTQSLLAAVGGTVNVPNSGAQVSIPAGGLVPAAGGAAAASVNVAVTPINPALDADVMPGDYTAVLAGDASPVPIESFGALVIDVRDDNGARYTLAAGQTANVRIPVGTLSATPPPTIPMLIFDAATGRWIEESVATLEGTAPNQVYVGTVARFGNWNADQKMNTVFVSGCVRDTATQPVANAKVKTDGVNYSGSATSYTDAAGNFRVALRRDALATLSVSFLDRDRKPFTKTENVGPFAADVTLPACIETVPALLQMTARPLPLGAVGTPYSARLAASNGTKPYAWNFSGALPTGLTLDNVTGQISGTPTVAGTFSGTFQVQDSSAPAQTASTPFTIIVTTPPAFGISTLALPHGVVGTAYSASLSAANGTTPYSWSVQTGNLPTSLILNDTTGQISGTPSVAGTFTFTIQAQDSSVSVKTASAPFTVVIDPPASPPPAPTGVAAVAGNTLASISWSPVSGATSYNLYMASVAGVTKSNYTTLTGGMKHIGVTSPYVHTGLTNGTTYYFVVTALNADGESVESGEVSAAPTAPPVLPPSVPAGVAAVPGNTQATIVWNPVSGATSYNLYMASVAGVTKSNYASLTGGMKHTGVTSPYVHTGLSNGTTYYFIVTAVNANGESVESVEVSATPTVGTVSRLAAGAYHTCALMSSGTVQCWGNNTFGQLGNGTTADSSTPVTVSGITTATAIAARGSHTCALLSDGTVRCWGSNGTGQLGNGTTADSSIPVTVIGITTATAIAAGSFSIVNTPINTGNACAVLSNGTVQCWGYNNYGQLGDGTTNTAKTPVTVSGITTATAIAAGGAYSCAILSTGTVQCWGNNALGQVGNGNTNNSYTPPVTVNGITTATAFAAAGSHTCAVLSSGTVQCWANNIVGQLGNGTTTNSSIPVTVSGITIATAIAAGSFSVINSPINNGYACAVLSNGAVQCWGYNASGQLGNETTNGSSIPVTVSSVTTATTITAGNAHTCAVLSNGTAQCWGLNSSGQLGNNTTTNSSIPVPVTGL